MKKVITFIFALTVFSSVAQDYRQDTLGSSTNLSAEKFASMISDSLQRMKAEKVAKYVPRVGGMLDFRYIYNENDAVSNSFSVARARLELSGDVAKTIDYSLLVEFAGSPRILDAFVRWKPLNAVNVLVGQFKLPFTLDNMASTYKYETIETTRSVVFLVGYSDMLTKNSSGRDIGVNLYGGFFKKDGYSIIEYNISVINGSGINRLDMNSAKTGMGTLKINPTKGLTFAGSFMGGLEGTPDKQYRCNRYTAGLLYDRGRLMVRSEYIGGVTGVLKSDGYYATAVYNVYKGFNAVVKYDLFRKDIKNTDTFETDYTAGINYLVGKMFRAQLNYTYCSRRVVDSYNMFGIQLKAAF